ncbi:MAG: nucleotide-binding protein [Thermoanaerobaculia bacterium]
MNKIIIAGAISLLLLGCSGKADITATKQKTAPAPAAAEAKAEAPSPSLVRVEGKVLETMDAAGYTYVRMQTPAGEVWAAVSATKLEKGADVAIDQQMIADNFKSSTLNRTFDHLIFGTIAPAGSPDPNMAAAIPAAAEPPVPAAHGKMVAAAEKDAAPVKVARATGANAKSVAEVWSERKALSGKPVVIHAKVVKFLPQIMGRNWIHLRDGSGSAAASDNDLVVTTQDTAAEGDVVTVTGTVQADHDLGRGLIYQVVVVDGKVAK